MGYLFLCLAVVGLGLLGVLHKVADFRRCRPAAVNLFLFFWAAVFAGGIVALRSGAEDVPGIPWGVPAVAGICGMFASIAIFNFQHGIRYGKISTSWLVVNLSTLVPTVLSIVVYREQINLKRGVGLMLVVASLLLLWLDRRREEAQEQPAQAVRENVSSRTPGGRP